MSHYFKSGFLLKPSRFIVIICSMIMLIACSEENSEQTYQMHLERAKAYEDQGQYKAAIIEYRNAVKKSDGVARPLVDYANMLIKVGQHDSALSLLEEVSTGHDKSYYQALVRAYQGKHKYLSAKKVLYQHLTDNSPESQLFKAHNHLGLGELDQAAQAYQAILNSNAADSLAKLGKAQLLARSGELEQSIELINSIPKDSEGYKKARILLAGIFINDQKLEEAEDVLTDLLSIMRNTDIIEPEKAVVLERLSYVLTRQGRSNEAYIYSKLLAEAFPGSNEVREKYQGAVTKLKAGDLEGSKAVLTDILNDYPSYKAATQLLGIISYLEGDNASASTYLSESVDPEVANEMTRNIYAATNLKMNDPKKVLEILEPNIDRTETPETLALYGLAAISDGQLQKGESALLKALSLDSKNVRVRMALADYYRSGPAADAKKEWEQLNEAYKTNQTDQQLLKNIVGFHLRSEEPKKAERFIGEALKSNPNDHATNMIAGYFSLNQSDLNTALKRFTKASEVKREGGDYLNSLFAKGKAEISLNKLEAAKSTFNELIRAFPDSELGYKGLLSVFLIDGKDEEGREKLEGFASRNTHLAPYNVLIQEAISKRDMVSAKKYFDDAKTAHGENERIQRLENGIKYVEALVAMGEGNFDVARTKAAEILTSTPDNMRLLSFLVDLELKADRINEAEKVLMQIKDIDADHPVVTLLSGDIAIANKEFDSAKAHLNKAWMEFPSDSVGEKLYKVLGALRDTTGQAKHLQAWLAKFPESTSGLMYQSLVYQQRGQRIKAIEGYEKVLERSPNNVMALNNLGWIYFEKKDSRALDLLERAVGLAPESPAVLDSYGWVLVENGQVSKGLPYLEKAHKLAPDMKEIEEHLLDARAR